MKLPKTYGIHKIRDAYICRLWAQDLLPLEDIGVKVKLSPRRIQQIVYNNRDYVKSNEAWEKTKRVIWLKKQIVLRGDTCKDSADLQEQLRKELEGDKPIIDNSRHLHVTVKKIDLDERIKTLKGELVGSSLPRT